MRRMMTTTFKQGPYLITNSSLILQRAKINIPCDRFDAFEQLWLGNKRKIKPM